MSTLKSVGNKLFKTELTSQRVELGIAEDLASLKNDGDSIVARLKKDDTDLININNQIDSIKKEAVKKKTEAIKNINIGEGYIKKMTSALTKAESAAKDLGLNVKSIPNYSELSKLIDLIEIYTEDKEFSHLKNI